MPGQNGRFDATGAILAALPRLFSADGPIRAGRAFWPSHPIRESRWSRAHVHARTRAYTRQRVR
ncbi:MAG: hypothetical protein WBL72_20100, partial [Thermoguttaceae bacterium]